MKHAWLVLAVLFLGWANVACTAEGDKTDQGKKESKKGEAERLWPRGPKVEELKAELGLTDDVIAKMKEALVPIQKKNDELEARADVKAAEDAVEKAKAALRAAEEKHNQAKDNFDLLAERKKAVYNLVPDDKKFKAQSLLNYKPEKPKEKKADKPADTGK
jgi:hypothetical protein